MSMYSRACVNLAAARILVIAAGTPMIATTIIISTREKPPSEPARLGKIDIITEGSKGKRCAAGLFPMGWRRTSERLSGTVVHPGTRHYITVSVEVGPGEREAGGGRRQTREKPRLDRRASRASRRNELERKGDGRLGLQVLVHKLGHLEHVDHRLAAENRFEVVVSLDVPPVLGVLQLVLLDVGP